MTFDWLRFVPQPPQKPRKSQRPPAVAARAAARRRGWASPAVATAAEGQPRRCAEAAPARTGRSGGLGRPKASGPGWRGRPEWAGQSGPAGVGRGTRGLPAARRRAPQSAEWPDRQAAVGAPDQDVTGRGLPRWNEPDDAQPRSSVVRCRAVGCRAVRCRAVRCRAVGYRAVGCSAVGCGAASRPSGQYRDRLAALEVSLPDHLPRSRPTGHPPAAIRPTHPP
jgi:hypothetical protein